MRTRKWFFSRSLKRSDDLHQTLLDAGFDSVAAPALYAVGRVISLVSLPVFAFLIAPKISSNLLFGFGFMTAAAFVGLVIPPAFVLYAKSRRHGKLGLEDDKEVSPSPGTQYLRSAGSRIVKAPPGHYLKRFGELFCSRESRELVLDDVITDMRDEYYEALAAGDRVKAIVVVWTYRLAYLSAATQESQILQWARQIIERVAK